MFKSEDGQKIDIEMDLDKLAKLTEQARRSSRENSAELHEEIVDLLCKTRPFRKMSKVCEIRSEAVKLLLFKKQWDADFVKLVLVISNP